MSISRIGVAGYMGSGKTTVAGIIAAKGYAVVDADSEAKQLMSKSPEIRQSLVDEFGEGILAAGQLSFGSLGRVAFASPDSLRRLNRIVHPPLVEYLRGRLDAASENTVLDAALIPLWGVVDWFDYAIWVHASAQTRRSRLQESTELAGEEILNRMRMQEIILEEPQGAPWRRVGNDCTTDELSRELDFVR